MTLGSSLALALNRAYSCRAIFFVLSLHGCVEEHTTPSVPTVVTLAVDVTPEGAVFHGEIPDFVDGGITERGFVWRRDEPPTLNDRHVLIESNSRKFSANITSGLSAGKTYHVRAYIRSGSKTIYANEIAFKSAGSSPPVILDFTPKQASIGTHVIVTGANIGLAKEAVIKVGNVEVKLISATNDEIVFEIPPVTTSVKAPLVMDLDGMITTSSGELEILFPWAKKSSVGLDEADAFFSDGKYGYFLQRNSDKIAVLDPTNSQWLSPITIPEVPSQNMIATWRNGKAYVAIGSKIKTLDTQTRQWADFTTVPPGVSIAYIFVLDDALYAGAFTGELHNYNFATQVWSEKHGLSNMSYRTSFSESGIVVGSKAFFQIKWELWYYDIAADLWAQVATHEGYSSNVFFAIGDKVYFGLGLSNEYDGGYVSSSMNSYDATSGVIQKYRNCPTGMATSGSVVLNNRAYIISYYGPWFKSYYSTWEFDPTRN